MSFFKSLVKNVPAASSIVADASSSAEFSGFIDSGSYTLNIALSGSLFGGLPSNKITVFAGESTTGKTFFVLGVLKNWLEKNPTGVAVYADTESAVTNDMMVARGIDTRRVLKLEPTTIEEFRNSMVKILANYEETDAKSRPPMIAILDSLGNLPSKKELEDVQAEKDTRDMTKGQVIRGTFRVLRLKLSRLNVPLVVTNHVYVNIMAYGAPNTMSGGPGLKYVSDNIMFLSKSKEKDKEKNVIGNVVRIKVEKSRLSVEFSVVETKIFYSGGLDRYAGLLDLAVASRVVKKLTAGRYKFPHVAEPVKEVDINNDPTGFYTDEVLQAMEPWVNQTFQYNDGNPSGPLDVTEFDAEGEEVDAE